MSAKQENNPILGRVTRTSMLYDLYGGLLTEKKRTVMELYHEEDMSLSEIAEEFEISRAAVHDALRTAENTLEDYERKLELLEGYEIRLNAARELRKIIEAHAEAFSPEEDARICELLDKLEN